MLIALVVLTACRRTESIKTVTATLPRTFEARLADQVAYKDCGTPSEPRASLRPALCPSLGAEEVWEAAATPPTDDALARAIRRLSLTPGEKGLRRALSDFAAVGGIDDGKRATARAAALHALAGTTGEDALLVDALEQVERAVELVPSSPAALFDRALIQGDLGLCREAAESWTAYLAADRASPWADEALKRRAALPCMSGKTTGGEADLLFETAMEDLVPKWAAARGGGKAEATELVDRLEHIGSRLVREARDPWLVSFAHELRWADLPEVSAVLAYARGRALFGSASFREAEPELRFARARLPENSVLLPWCDVWLAGIRLTAGDFQGAERLLSGYLEDAAVRRSPLLSGRITWTLGLIAFRAGRLEAAHDLLVDAKGRLKDGGYLLSAAWVGVTEAETLTDLGFTRESWQARIDALWILQGRIDRPALHNGLIGAMQTAMLVESFRAADAFAREANSIDRETGDTVDASDTELTRGEELLRHGEEEPAIRAFRRSLEEVASVDDDEVRRWVGARARLGLWAAGAEDVSGALVGLDSIVTYFAGKGPAWREIQALRVLASTLAHRGEAEDADAAIRRAIGRIRAVQRELGDEPMSLRHWEFVQDAFDEAISQALAADRPVEALAWLEEARRPHGGPPVVLPFAACRPAAAPSGVPPAADSSPVTVVYGAIGQRLVWWRIDRGRCELGFENAVAARTAVDEVVARAPSKAIDPDLLERLYRDLLSAPLRGVGAGRPLILVPDRYLLRVPFAALVDPETGRHLIEERALSFRFALVDERGERRAVAPHRSRWRAVVVGDPAFDRSRLPWLPRLPGAEREAREVADLYAGRAVLLTGEDASASRIAAALARRQILHLAVHAVPGADGTRDALVLAPDPGSDPGSASSGLVSSRSLLRAGEPAPEMVVLSACSTLGSTPSRSGGLLGLAQAFVARGAAAVVGTLWPIDDRVLTPIMVDFHRGLRGGLSASESLRRAQVAALERARPGECCDWAAVQMIGDIEPGVASATAQGTP